MIMDRAGTRLFVTLLGAAAVSVATAALVAQLRSFRISEVGGYFYWLVVSPVGGMILGFVAYLTLQSVLSGWRLIGSGVGLVALIGIFAHVWALDHGQIGGEYVPPKRFEARSLSTADLFRLLDERNRAVAGRAWVELEARAQDDQEIMWQALQVFREKEPVTYVDSHRTHGAVGVLARRGDRRVIPILQEILRSQETSTVTLPGGTGRVSYHNRAFAKDLLAHSFGMSADVETERPLDEAQKRQ